MVIYEMHVRGFTKLHPDVREELARWGRWFLETTGVDGFRLDAARHPLGIARRERTPRAGPYTLAHV